MNELFRFGEFDRVVIGGIPMRWVSTHADGHVFRHVDAGAAEAGYTHAGLAAQMAKPDFRYHRGYFEPGRAATRLNSGVENFADIPRAELARTLDRAGWVSEFLKLEQEQKNDPPADKGSRISRSYRGLKRAIEIICDRRKIAAANELTKFVEGTPRKLRFGSSSQQLESCVGSANEVSFPHEKTLHNWILAHEKAGTEDPSHHRDRARFCGGGLKVALDVEAILARVAALYASETRPTKVALFKVLVDEVAKHNEQLAKAGEPFVKTPCSKTLSRRVDALDQYMVRHCRRGAKSARNQFLPVTQGIDAQRPGQVVVIDEWKVSIRVLFVQSGVWEKLTKEQRKKVKRIRPWLCVAIDVASRAILGAAIALEQTSKTVVEVIKMMMSDKGHISNAVGAKSSWSQRLTPEVVLTDAGSNLISDEVRSVLIGLGITNKTAPAGFPQLRAHVERLFGTMNTEMLAWFTGRTFANVVDRGKYDSGGHAMLDIDDLCWLIVRYFVDQYHNSPHEGLNKATPADEFDHLVAHFGRLPFPDRHRMRSVFGFDLTRRTGPRGIRMLGLHYQGHALQEYRRAKGDGTVTIRVDGDDIGSVAVLLGKDWHALDCVSPCFDGVGLIQWIESAKVLQTKPRAAAAAHVRRNVDGSPA